MQTASQALLLHLCACLALTLIWPAADLWQDCERGFPEQRSKRQQRAWDELNMALGLRHGIVEALMASLETTENLLPDAEYATQVGLRACRPAGRPPPGHMPAAVGQRGGCWMGSR